MNKSDLKDYMVVEYRIGELRIIINNNLYAIDDGKLREVNNLNNYDDELKSKGLHEDIVKVYDTLLVLTNKQNIKPLWERKEIDWSKVPLGAKVIVSNDNFYTEEVMYFINKSGNDYFVVDLDRDEIGYFKYCKLAEDPKEEVTISEIEEEFHKVCKFNESEYACEKCKFKNGNNDSGCVTSIILSKYNVTRK